MKVAVYSKALGEQVVKAKNDEGESVGVEKKGGGKERESDVSRLSSR